MNYLLLKTVHQTAVVMSFIGFAARGLGSLGGAGWVRHRAARTVPHVVDTVLLASAVALAVMSRQYPLVNGWLTAKVAGLLIYIGLGTVALKRGKTRRVRIAAWVAAQAVFFYIVAVALTRQPLPWPV